MWNSIDGTMQLTERRINGIKEHIDNIYKNNCRVTARELASVVGKIISAGPVFGNISRIRTRYCTSSGAQHWDSVLELD